MGRIVEYADKFLDAGGRDLGYSELTIPEIKDIDVVLEYQVPVWEYKGVTEEEYYSIDENEGKTIP